MRRIIGHPGVQLFAVLLIVALIAERRLLGASPLGGGALVPAWGGAPRCGASTSRDSTRSASDPPRPRPPYLAVVAALGTVLGGQAWLAVDVLLLGCVPLAGLTAYLATRRLVTATAARVLLAASYALLPVATGAVAAGRLGTAVAFIAAPADRGQRRPDAHRAAPAGAPRRVGDRPAGRGGGRVRAARLGPRRGVRGGALAARRWLLAGRPGQRRHRRRGAVLRCSSRGRCTCSAPRSPSCPRRACPTPGLTTAGLRPAALLALSPGGPGLPPVWVTVGFGLALLAVLLPARRTGLTVVGLERGHRRLPRRGRASAGSTSRPQGGGQPAAGWPGVALALAALGLLLAAAPAAQWLAGIIANGNGDLPAGPAVPGPRRPPGRLRPVTQAARLRRAGRRGHRAAAGRRLLGQGRRAGAGGQRHLAAAARLRVRSRPPRGAQYRTLILRPNGGVLDYMVVRQGDPSLGEPELATASAAEQALSRQVAALARPTGPTRAIPAWCSASSGSGGCCCPARLTRPSPSGSTRPSASWR